MGSPLNIAFQAGLWWTAACVGFGQTALRVQPAHQTVEVRAAVTFQASFEGDPPLSFQWHFNGLPLPGATSSMLFLYNVQYTNVGDYTVVADTLFGPVTSPVARLNVHEAELVLVGGRQLLLGTPANLGPAINTEAGEGEPNLSPDGLTLVFASDRPDGFGGRDLWMATRPVPTAPFGPPVNLGPGINSSGHQTISTFSPDGLTLYFSGTGDIMVATRSNLTGPFGPATSVGPPINTDEWWESGPKLSGDGLTLFFNSDQPGGEGMDDIWMATRPNLEASFGPPVNLGPSVNTPGEEWTGNPSPDGRLHILAALSRPGGFGLADLWVTVRASAAAPYGTPVNLGSSVNTANNEGPPHWSSDGTVLYFPSDRPDGYGGFDLWQVSVTELPRLRAVGWPSGGDFELELAGGLGLDYAIEVSEDLSWWTAWRTVTPTNRTMRVIDPEAPGLRQRYYRAAPR